MKNRYVKVIAAGLILISVLSCTKDNRLETERKHVAYFGVVASQVSVSRVSNGADIEVEVKKSTAGSYRVED